MFSTCAISGLAARLAESHQTTQCVAIMDMDFLPTLGILRCHAGQNACEKHDEEIARASCAAFTELIPPAHRAKFFFQVNHEAITNKSGHCPMLSDGNL